MQLQTKKQKKLKFKKRKGFLIAVIAIAVMALISVIAATFAFAYSADRSGAMSGSGEVEDTTNKNPDATAPVQVPTGPCSERIIKVATEGVGAHETADNQGPKNNPPVTQGITPDYKHGSVNRQPWCAYFASWVLQSAGDKIPTIASARGIYDYYAGKGQGFSAGSVSSGTNTPQPGDIFVKSRVGGNHVGIVTGYSNGRVSTIEGNSSNQVRRSSQSLSEITGFGRPQCQ